MKREKIAEKLKKIKALAERGEGGEKETAMKMYRELAEKYQISEEEIDAEHLEKRWFAYKDEQEEKLLLQIFYKVTGSTEHYVYTGKYKRRKKRGCVCTELEAAGIKLLFNFYNAEYKREQKYFWMAFLSGNDLYPDETTRCYKAHEAELSSLPSREERRMMMKASVYRDLMDKRKPPEALIGEEDEEK